MSMSSEMAKCDDDAVERIRCECLGVEERTECCAVRRWYNVSITGAVDGSV